MRVSSDERKPGHSSELRLRSHFGVTAADKLLSCNGPENPVERLIQLLDEVDEVVGLAMFGAWANGRRLVLLGSLLAVTMVALLVPL
jgi:hypothetical protein